MHDVVYSIWIMDFLQYTIDSNDADRRADRVLRKFLPGLSLAEIYSAFRKGFVRSQEKKIRQESRLSLGDQLSIARFLVEKSESASKKVADREQESFPPAVDFQVLFANQYLLIINKPYDYSVQGKKDSLDAVVKNQFPAPKDSLSFSVGPLHRLDKKTTGVLCFSQNLEGANVFSQMIQNHSIKKFYLALLEGNLEKECTWTDYILQDKGAEKTGFFTVKVFDSEVPGSKNAVTSPCPLAHGFFDGKPVTLAYISIETGRTHQIRAQSAFHGHCLLGDNAYGSHEKLDSGKYGRSFFLHAVKILFPENKIGLPESVSAPLPEDFAVMVRQCFDQDIRL